MKSSSPGPTENGPLEQGSFLIALVIVSLLFLFMLWPFWGAILWACIIGLLFGPMYKQLLTFGAKPRPNIAAMLSLLVCLVMGILPALFVVASFFKEGAALYQRINNGDFNIKDQIDQIQQAFPAVPAFLERFNIDIGQIQSQLSELALAASGLVAQNALQFGQGTLNFVVGLTLMLYVAFFMLRDGEKIVELIIRALPLGDEREHLLLNKFAEVVRATVKGNLLVAAVQGILGGLIFWVLGINGALLWGVVMTLLAMIPVVGASLIWGPVAVYLFATGETNQGIILTLYGAFIIGLADNILRPLLVGRDAKLPDYLVLLSTLGGFSVFGMNGFVLGPLVAALFLSFWEIFIREFNTVEEFIQGKPTGISYKPDGLERDDPPTGQS